MPFAFQVAFPVLALLNTVLAAFVLLRGPRPVRASRVGSTVGAVLLANAVEMLVLSRFRLHFFGVVHVAFIDLWCVAPLAGLALLVAAARGTAVTRPALVLAWLALPGLPLGLYAQLVEPYDVRLEQTVVPMSPARAGSDDLLVAVLADIQSTTIEDHQREAVARVMAAQPDLILIPGDLYQGPVDQWEANRAGFHELLASLHAPGGVWVVPGNADVPSVLPLALAGTDARLLRDELVTITVRDRTITLLGLDEIPHERYQVWREPPPVLQQFVDAPGDDDLRILLSHRPRVVNDLPPDSRCDLIVAGHTHGGQVALPFYGPPITLSPLPRAVAAGGLHELDGNRVYVSRGLGMERLQAPRLRFLVPPEVTLLTFSSRPPAQLP